MEHYDCAVHGRLYEDECQVFIHKTGNKQLTCKICNREYARKYYLLNKEKVKVTNNAWREKNPEKVKENKKKWQQANVDHHRETNAKYRDKHRVRLNIMARVREYGITIEEYKAMIVAQDNKCAICFLPETKIWRGKQTELCLDHCHKNGGLRQLLCFQCNLGLGAFKDDPVRLQSAITYLKKHQQ